MKVLLVMASRTLESIDVHTALDRAANESAQAASAELIRMATSSRAMASVQGLVGSCFYRLHLRQLPQVISVLLLQLFLVRQENAEGRDHQARMRRRLADLESGKASETSRLKQRIQELMKQNTKYKDKYEELYKINQHWSLDYEVLKKQLQELEKPAEHQTSTPPATPEKCRKCVLLEGEINTKSELLLDVQHTLEKLKIRNQDAEADLMEKERDIQQLKNECDSLNMQLREYGRYYKQRDERYHLQHEVQTLREKCRIAESEQARLHSQISHLKETMWTMFYRSDHPRARTAGYAVDTSYTDGISRHRSKSKSTQHTAASYNKDPYPTPATPPGLLSRGQLIDSEDSCTATLTKSSSQYLDPFRLSPPAYVPRPLSAPGFLGAELSQNGAEPSQNGTESSPLCYPTTSRICKNGLDHKNGLKHIASDSSLHLTVRNRPENRPLTAVQNPHSITSSLLLSRNSDSNQNYTVAEIIATKDLS